MNAREERNKMGTCFDCRHFVNDPRQLELSIPGLNTLSSAYASVRGESGLCSRLDLFLAPGGDCPNFEREGEAPLAD